MKRVDPALLDGEELDQWYRRSPEEVEEERRVRDRQTYDEFFYGEGWEDARLQTPAVRTAPRQTLPEARVAPPVVGPSAQSGSPGSFFASYSPLPGGQEYVTGLPAPLNRVEPSVVMSDRYVLGDGSVVSGREVDRLYAEQQRRLRGEELAPSPYPKAVDRLRDGQIPSAEQLVSGEWERDPTCHPYGGWEIDRGFPYYPKRSQDYEAQVTGARGVDYVVRNPGAKPVKFDGYDVVNPAHPLQEAKGPGYAGLFEAAKRYPDAFQRFLFGGLSGQVGRQVGAVGGRPVDWYVAEQPAMEPLKRIVAERVVRLRHVPAR